MKFHVTDFIIYKGKRKDVLPLWTYIMLYLSGAALGVTGVTLLSCNIFTCIK